MLRRVKTLRCGIHQALLLPVARRVATLQYFMFEVSQGEVEQSQEHVRPGEVARHETISCASEQSQQTDAVWHRVPLVSTSS